MVSLQPWDRFIRRPNLRKDLTSETNFCRYNEMREMPRMYGSMPDEGDRNIRKRISGARKLCIPSLYQLWLLCRHLRF